MSWSASTPSPIAKSAIVSIDSQPQLQPDGVEDAYADHIAAAKEAVQILAQAVGIPADLVQVSMSGHANPDHAPAPGWSDEFITISVYARPSKPEVAAA